jgi:NDP-sugar pyrophosphorylase family protein
LNCSCNSNGRVTTALLLAAGTGSRMYPLTQDMPKCLTMVNGVPILDRLVSCLNQQGFKRLIVITGHLENRIREFLGNQAGNIKIDYIFSPLYETTNNIYSLWMAREIINEPFLLIESDLVFHASLLDDMLYPDRIAVAPMQPWMNGSTVTVNQFNQVDAFQNGAAGPADETRYKTVNIYSLSLSSWQGIAERLDQYISTGRVNDYYEAVFSEMVADSSLSLEAVYSDSKQWYEIDTIADLSKAEKLFSGERYETTIPYNILPDTPGISRHFFQQSGSRERKQAIISLSGLRSFSQPDSLINIKPTQGSNIQDKVADLKDISAGTKYGAL